MAKEYIEREALRSKLDGWKLRYVQSDNLIGKTVIAVIEGFINLLERETAADVVEVVHAYWKPSPDGINPIRCSECNMPAPFAAGENEFGDFEIYRYPSSYCHECGAKMDGGKE